MTAFCPACCTWLDTFVLDRAGNPRGCTVCQSLERHRVLAVLLPAVAALARQAREHAEPPRPLLLVDVAPSAALERALTRVPEAQVVRMDFDPGADGRAVDVRASVTAVPLADGSVDLLLCSHVLEHVPDDLAAMRDLARVIGERGIGVVVVPWRPGPTDEDPDASAPERIARFGQADHVRYYGDDFDARLAGAGLSVETFRADELVEPWVAALLRLLPGERFWLVRPMTSPHKLPAVGDVRDRVGHELAACLSAGDAATRAAERAEAARWREQAVGWQERYQRLRARRTVRLLFALGRARARVERRLHR